MPSAQTAYDQLISAIETGGLCPGDRLLETELAAKFGVSRTPVREAIRRLESDGIVEHKPRVGAVVRSLGQQEIVELYEMRIVLEATAATMAAQHASVAELDTLDQLNTDMAAASGNAFAVAALNRRFHNCIMNAARNRFLAQSYNALSHALVVLGKTTLASPDRVEQVCAQHHAIIQALRAGDGTAAAQAMRDHMQASLRQRLAHA